MVSAEPTERGASLSSLPACAAGSGHPGTRPGHGVGGQRAPGHPPCRAQGWARMATVDLGLSFRVAFHTATANPRALTSLERVQERSHGTHGCAGHHRSEGPPPRRAPSPTTPTWAIPKVPEPRGSLLGRVRGCVAGACPRGSYEALLRPGGPADQQHQTLHWDPTRGRQCALRGRVWHHHTAAAGPPCPPPGCTHAASGPLPGLICSTACLLLPCPLERLCGHTAPTSHEKVRSEHACVPFQTSQHPKRRAQKPVGENFPLPPSR